MRFGVDTHIGIHIGNENPTAIDTTMAIDVGIVVVAAGSGARLGHSDPKAFVAVGGRPILAHALEGT
jgi:UDP-N-acetylglucosamine pyrophosphorylase